MGVGRRIWSTLHEPRAISAMMAATYTLIAGLVVVAVEDAARALTSDHWPGWPLFIILALLLMIGQRMVRVWGHTWQPGCEPDTPLRQAEISATAAKALEADAAARAYEREDNGCRKRS